jgi:phage tail sheath protein FI
VRINRELNAKLGALFLQGAFAGATPDEAFSVKCDADNNPDDVRASGKLQIDIQIAPIIPKEFIQIRVVRSADGLTVT